MSIDNDIRNAEATYAVEQTERNAQRLIQLYLRAGRHDAVTQFERPEGRIIPTRQFAANNSAGNCGLCDQPFVTGAQAFYLSTLRRPNGERSYQQLGRGESSVRFRPEDCNCNGYRFHTRRCRLRGRVFWRYETLPGVWERMVHVGCAAAEGYTVPESHVAAEPGTRTVGMGHTPQ